VIDCDWLVCLLVGSLVGWLIDWLIDWSIDWFDWLDWLTGLIQPNSVTCNVYPIIVKFLYLQIHRLLKVYMCFERSGGTRQFSLIAGRFYARCAAMKTSCRRSCISFFVRQSRSCWMITDEMTAKVCRRSESAGAWCTQQPGLQTFCAPTGFGW